MRWLIIGLTIFAVSAAPNLYWLSGSSIVLRNESSEPMTIRLALADDPDRLVDLGEIAPGEGHFSWLHVTGEATLEVDVLDGDNWHRHCREYVEEATYRVKIVVTSPREVACKTSLAALHHLLLVDYLSGL